MGSLKMQTPGGRSLAWKPFVAMCGAILAAAAGCERAEGPSSPAFAVSGRVSGLAPGNVLVLENNGSDRMIVVADGPFTFPTPLVDGSPIAVAVLFQPTSPNQTCEVSGGAGVIDGASATGVRVRCATLSYRVRGRVTGLAFGAEVVLVDGTGESLVIDANGPFELATPLQDCTPFSVTVQAHPSEPTQTCAVQHGVGTVAGDDVTGVVVECTTITFSVGGVVTGLGPDNSVRLRNDGGGTVTVDGNGSFQFPTRRPDGSAYAVSVLERPTNPDETCSVENGSGRIDGRNVTNVIVRCWGAVDVDVGGYHGCALAADGSLLCWGSDSRGQATPPVGTGFTAVATGDEFSCALAQDRSVACWGAYGYGDPATPPAGNDFVSVAAGCRHACAIRDGGTLACWGHNDHFEASPPPGADFAAVTAGLMHSCAVRLDGSLACWGWVYEVEGTPGGTGYAAVAAGSFHTCALRVDGSIVCWGDDSYGQLRAPAGNDYAAVAAGYYHTCALKLDGTLACWGDDYQGAATAPAGTFSAVAAGRSRNAVIRPDGSVWYWGDW